MIIRDQPSSFQLFFVMQGSIIPKVFAKILSIALFSAVILIVDLYLVQLPHFSIAAMSVFGVGLSLFLGFRNNAAYDRWWEARKLWGSMIADVRSLGRETSVFIGDGQDRDQILSYAVVFSHLHRGYLRDVDVRSEIGLWIAEVDVANLAAKKNPADCALGKIATQISQLAERDAVSSFGQMTLSQTLSSLARAQAGCERIVTTPLPYVYSLLVRRTTYLYCWLLPFALIETSNLFTPVFVAVVAYVFFGLQAVTNELEQPFHNVQNGLPLDAMCRTIEISVSEAIGRSAPDPIVVKDFVLT